MTKEEEKKVQPMNYSENQAMLPVLSVVRNHPGSKSDEETISSNTGVS